MDISFQFVIRPWWKRFVLAFELLLFGSVEIEGELKDPREHDPAFQSET